MRQRAFTKDVRKLKGMESKDEASKMVLEDNFPKELAQMERRHASTEQETSEHA